MSEFALIAVAAIFSSNIVAVCGVGAVSLQSEKKNFGFMCITSLFTILSLVATGCLYSLLETYLLAKLDMVYLKLFVTICLACVCAFISKSFIKLISKEDYFLYERSYSFPVQIAVTVGAIMLIDFNIPFLTALFTLAMFSSGYLLTQVVFYALYEKLDSTYALKPARNVPVMLFTLRVVCMILYAVAMFF